MSTHAALKLSEYIFQLLYLHQIAKYKAVTILKTTPSKSTYSFPEGFQYFHVSWSRDSTATKITGKSPQNQITFGMKRPQTKTKLHWQICTSILLPAMYPTSQILTSLVLGTVPSPTHLCYMFVRIMNNLNPPHLSSSFVCINMWSILATYRENRTEDIDLLGLISSLSWSAADLYNF